MFVTNIYSVTNIIFSGYVSYMKSNFVVCCSLLYMENQFQKNAFIEFQGKDRKVSATPQRDFFESEEEIYSGFSLTTVGKQIEVIL